ncbi:MAG: hypothetical protein P8105_03740 [Dehalococcoidia bacterium]
MFKKSYPDYSANIYNCKNDGEKQGVQLSKGFVYLIGLILFVMVFSGIVVFGSGYAAGDSNTSGTGMDFDSSCLWLDGSNYKTEQSFDNLTVADTGSGTPQLDLANTLSDGEITCLRPFKSYRELKQFLDEDLTDKHIYSMSFDCDDFAFMLSQNALNKGYQIFPFAEGSHLKNVAHVALGDAVVVYVVEPQTDEVRIWGKVD